MDEDTPNGTLKRRLLTGSKLGIQSLQIKNYKSYLDSSTLNLCQGFNIIAGQNNAGKTALFEILKLDFVPHPHRSLKTLPSQSTRIDGSSSIELTFQVNGAEFREALVRPGATILLPQPYSNALIRQELGMRGNTPQDQELLLEWVLSRPNLVIKIKRGSGSECIDCPSFGLYEAAGKPGAWNIYRIAINNFGTFEFPNSAQQMPNDLGSSMAGILCQRIYSFKAERYNLGGGQVGPNAVLSPNASNLAEVLANLQTNREQFDEFNQAIRQVLPQIQRVAVRNIANYNLEIIVWPSGADLRRNDLAISLSECGTGVGQVLAILYVVTNSPFPRIILIDEPQSFLHPGAVRKLIEVLKLYPEHQYVIATHSPTIITAAHPATVTLIKQEGGVSDFQVIDPTENQHLRDFLAEIGARLSDVFGADDILWVEGPTEERCFPMILERVAKCPLMGTAIVAVTDTGSLEGQHKEKVLETV
jgi:hypothetical protein